MPQHREPPASIRRAALLDALESIGIPAKGARLVGLACDPDHMEITSRRAGEMDLVTYGVTLDVPLTKG